MLNAYSHTTDIFPCFTSISFVHILQGAHEVRSVELPIQLHGHVVHEYRVVCRVPTVDHVSFHLDIGLGWMMPFQERRNVSTVGHAAVQFHVIGFHSHNRSQPGHESDSSWKCTVVLCLHCNIYIYKKTCREIIGDMSVGREAGRHQAWKSDILKTVSTHIGFN